MIYILKSQPLTYPILVLVGLSWPAVHNWRDLLLMSADDNIQMCVLHGIKLVVLHVYNWINEFSVAL